MPTPPPPNPPNPPDPPDASGNPASEPDPDPSYDLSRILAGWPYEPGKLSARIVPGDDGEPRLQIRLDLGLLQMQLEGRPDGQRPRGFDSLLEYHEARLDEHTSRHGPSSGGGEGGGGGENEFMLSGDECRELREEAVQYYQRYTGLLVMEDYDGVVRDTTRNIRLLDFCKRYAESENDRNALEQFRAYITMTRARALASQALKDNEPKAALHAVEEGLDALRQHYEPGDYEQSGEVQMLSQMRDALIPKQPLTPRQDLKKRLAEAVAKENYELAAILRDQLKNTVE